MKTAFRFAALALLLLAPFAFPALGQMDQELYNELRLRRHSLSAGGHAHTHGLGIDVLYFRKKKRETERYFSFALSSLKDAREDRAPSQYAKVGGQDFIYDKLNYVYMLGLTYGLQRSILKLGAYNRMSFRLGVSAGPVFAFMKPYYLEIAVPLPGPTPTAVVEEGTVDDRMLLDRSIDFNDIVGEAEFFSGFDETSVLPGGRVRVHGALNLASSNLQIQALHFGLQFDAYIKPLPIFYRLENDQYFLTGWIGVVFGKSWD